MTLRLLVVEDDPVLRLPLRAALAAAGLTVLLADSAEAAERMLALASVDVVLSDIRLPGMDGLTLARRHPDTPFVLMTGSPPADRPPLGGVRACLQKPFEISDLLTVLESTMKGVAHAGSSGSAQGAPAGRHRGVGR